MTREEACLYLGLSPDEELDFYRIENSYNVKASMYDLSRFEPDTPEYREAKKMLDNIEKAFDFLLANYAERNASEDYAGLVGTHIRLTAKHVVALCIGLLILVVVFVLCMGNKREVPQTLHAGKASGYVAIELPVAEEIEIRSHNNNDTGYVALVERVMPSTVLIQTGPERLGSGFLVSPNGDILTNWHVIDGAEYITVTTQDGQNVGALAKGYDAQRDMALLKVNTSYSLPYLSISGEYPRQGERIIAIGNPRGFQGTVSDGIVSAYRQDGSNNFWMQFTAPVSPGSSGGALLNLKGEVVGMTTANYDGQNLNFAVPCVAMREFVASAINKPALTLPPKSYRKLDDIPGVQFVRKDDKYEMYLATESVNYDKRTHIASFITFWLPSEKAKAEMRKDPHFIIRPGEELGVCMLHYNINLRDNTYVHLETVNFCTNGNVARDYPRPPDEIRWRTAKKGSRIESLMKEVKRQLRIR